MNFCRRLFAPCFSVAHAHDVTWKSKDKYEDKDLQFALHQSLARVLESTLEE